MCHWPRQGGLWRWVDELLAGYIESPCDYTDPRQGGHGQSGIWDKGYVRLRRSQDDGMLFNNGASVAEQRRVLRLDEYGTARDGSPSGPPRDVLDMSGKEAVFMMGRAWCGDEVSIQDNRAVRNNIAYCYRSIDRGHQWETTPSILFPHHTKTVVELANNVAPLGDGRYVAWLVGYGGVEGASSPQGAPYSPQLVRHRRSGRVLAFLWRDLWRSIPSYRCFLSANPLSAGRALVMCPWMLVSGRGGAPTMDSRDHFRRQRPVVVTTQKDSHVVRFALSSSAERWTDRPHLHAPES
jgi:hypothetical protein